MNQEFLSPLLLEADRFSLPINGSWGSFNPQQLMNPNRTPMLIDELRFSGMQTPFATPGFDESDTASLVCKITFGNSNLTNDFVPLPVLAPTYLSYGSDATRTFHLPKPLYVPPGVQINCTLQRKLPPGWNAPIDPNTPFGFAIAGRSIPAGMPVPRKIFLPWVCSTSVRTTQIPFTSKDNEIGNPFDSDLRFTQLVGFNLHEAVADPFTASCSVTRSPITIQATYGSGKMLIRDPVPFLSLFPPTRPIAPMQGLLKPKDFLKVTLDMPQPVGFTNMLFTSVGLVGYRTLDTPLGALP